MILGSYLLFILYNTYFNILKYYLIYRLSISTRFEYPKIDKIINHEIFSKIIGPNFVLKKILIKGKFISLKKLGSKKGSRFSITLLFTIYQVQFMIIYPPYQS